jgi:hypothetical protein
MSVTEATHRPAESGAYVDATWSVTSESRGPALARVLDRGDSLEVRVGDGVTDSRGLLRSAAFATLRGDGSLSLRTHAAPPALWVQTEGIWLLPSRASGPEPRMRTEDRLLLLSADALEAEPSGLVALLGMAADAVLTVPTHELLSLLLPAVGPGAAAVVCRTPATTATAASTDC